MRCGTTLGAGNACWVDVAQLCADAAAAAQGNHPSQLQADSVSVTAGAQTSGNVLTNDSDADGPLTVASFKYQGMTYAAGTTVPIAGYGTLSIQSNGAYTFTAASPFVGTSPMGWTYIVQTGESSTLSITVSTPPPNSPPVANNDTTTTDEDIAVTVAVLGNDTDVDGDSLLVTGVTQGANGSVVIDAVSKNPVYTPNPGFVGNDTFTYTISDGKGGSATGTVTVPARSVAVLTEAQPVATHVIAQPSRLLVRHGSSVSVSGKVTADDRSAPVGTVTVTDNGTTVATVTLDADDRGRFSVTLPALRRGLHVVRVTFTGAPGWLDSRARGVLPVVAY